MSDNRVIITPSRPSFGVLSTPDSSSRRDESCPARDRRHLLTERPAPPSPHTPETLTAHRLPANYASGLSMSPFRRSRCQCIRVDIIGELHSRNCFGLTKGVFSYLSARDLKWYATDVAAKSLSVPARALLNTNLISTGFLLFLTASCWSRKCGTRLSVLIRKVAHFYSASLNEKGAEAGKCSFVGSAWDR